jgi:signal recognition particle GTPase
VILRWQRWIAEKHYHDVLIVDTAGRLGIDEAMMGNAAIGAVNDRNPVRR